MRLRFARFRTSQDSATQEQLNSSFKSRRKSVKSLKILGNLKRALEKSYKIDLVIARDPES